MKSSDYIVKFFAERGVTVIFGYIGGVITHLVDSIDKSDKVKYVQTYHEQTAAIAAEGYAIESGNFGVAISTSGPGATNMITGIADAYFDSIPVIYITGQVNSYEYKYEKPIRQQGFQETDIVSVVKPISKYATLVDKIEDLRYELEKAVFIATTGRKGPVLLDLPMNIQRAEIEPNTMRSFKTEMSEQLDFDLSFVVEALNKSESPMLLLGGGCQSKAVKKEISRFLTKTQIPVITSLMGKGVVDETYVYYNGMLGSYGNRCANMGVANADLLIVLGSRLDTRQTGAMIDSFLIDSTIIHVDIDKDELDSHRITRQIKIHAEVGSFLEKLNKADLKMNNISVWQQYIQNLHSEYSQANEVARFVENKAPYKYIEYLNSMMNEGDIVTTDVGQNQMWAAQSLQLKSGQLYLTSGGLAPMGYSMPSAIGSSFSNPNRQVYSIMGDGGFHMSLQSLPVISQYHLNIKLCVLNNSSLGMITQFQHLYFNDRMAGTVAEGGYYTPDIEGLAKSYGIKYFRITESDLNNEALKTKILNTKTCLIEFIIDGLTTVSPKLEFNQPISKPFPQLSEEEYSKTMKIN